MKEKLSGMSLREGCWPLCQTMLFCTCCTHQELLNGSQLREAYYCLQGGLCIYCRNRIWRHYRQLEASQSCLVGLQIFDSENKKIWAVWFDIYHIKAWWALAAWLAELGLGDGTDKISEVRLPLIALASQAMCMNCHTVLMFKASTLDSTSYSCSAIIQEQKTISQLFPMSVEIFPASLTSLNFFKQSCQFRGFDCNLETIL